MTGINAGQKDLYASLEWLENVRLGSLFTEVWILIPADDTFKHVLAPINDSSRLGTAFDNVLKHLSVWVAAIHRLACSINIDNLSITKPVSISLIL